VNLQTLTRDIDRLSTADALVVDNYVRHLFGKFGFYLVAGVLAAAGVALLELASFWLLAQRVGPIGAAGIIGAIDCVLATSILLFATQLTAGREFSMALEMRKSAIEALEQDVSTPGGLQGNGQTTAYPLSEAVISSIVLPLIAALLRSFRAGGKEEPMLDVEKSGLMPAPKAGSK